MKSIVVVIGLPGAGKSEASKIFKELGMPMFRTGDVVRNEVVRRGMQLTMENQEKVSIEMRKAEGMDAPAKRILDKIRDTDNGMVVVEGPRNIEEVDTLATVGDVVLLVVEAPSKTRFERLCKRAETRDPKKPQELEWRDRKELGRGMAELLKTDKYPCHIIKNTGNLKDLKENINKFLDKIL
jgi:dephospho-CoA kinase